MKDDRHEPARVPQPLMLSELALQQRFQRGREREAPAFPILRRTWVEPHDTARPVYLSPFERQDLTRQAPAGQVGEPDERLKRRR